jgi:hypothetical protein
MGAAALHGRGCRAFGWPQRQNENRRRTSGWKPSVCLLAGPVRGNGHRRHKGHKKGRAADGGRRSAWSRTPCVGWPQRQNENRRRTSGWKPSVCLLAGPVRGNGHRRHKGHKKGRAADGGRRSAWSRVPCVWMATKAEREQKEEFRLEAIGLPARRPGAGEWPQEAQRAQKRTGGRRWPPLCMVAGAVLWMATKGTESQRSRSGTAAPLWTLLAFVSFSVFCEFCAFCGHKQPPL